MKMNCYIDGDHLCIVREDFENLQEDNAVFIPLNSDQINKINIIDPKICRKCGSVVIDYTTKENGLCDFCEGE